MPNTEGLGLATAGIETDRGFVQVDDHMRVLKKKGGETVPGLFCIGDANGNYFTLIQSLTTPLSPMLLYLNFPYTR